jgi:oligopeptide transport system ATP-binding protein
VPGGRSWDTLALPEAEMRALRGNRISMIFQEPMTSLNPVKTVGEQIAEAIRCHQPVGHAAALERAADLLDLVGIPAPRQRLASYPHHMSGGMRQRVMIAMALACEPDLLIADEPTTALDVTVQAQIIELLKRLQERTGMSVIFITHNLGVVAEIADRVMVMYAGRIVEQAPTVPLLTGALMPYTQGLLRSVPLLPRGGTRRGRLEAIAGNVPDPARLPPGCSFAPRCPHVDPGRCGAAVPMLDAATDAHLVRCLRWRELAREMA